MTNKHQTFIADERLDDLLTCMRRMPVTAIAGRQARITLNLEDPLFASWARVTERMAPDLTTPGGDLTWLQGVEIASQRVAGDATAALGRGRQ